VALAKVSQPGYEGSSRRRPHAETRSRPGGKGSGEGHVRPIIGRPLRGYVYVAGPVCGRGGIERLGSAWPAGSSPRCRPS
jgi:hypothetical protein